ncbi:hypothetical protein ACSBR2_001470 [Camellia fascicularis]
MTNGIPHESAPLEVSIVLSIAEVEEPIVDEAGRVAKDIATDIEAEEIYPPRHEPQLPPLRVWLMDKLEVVDPMSFQLRRVSSSFLMQNVVSPQAFMSSSIATEAVQESSTSKAYGSEQIQVLEGLDPVRKRPGMYIGSTGPRDNAVDEAQADSNGLAPSDQKIGFGDSVDGIRSYCLA